VLYFELGTDTESQCKGNDMPSIRSHVEDEERMRCLLVRLGNATSDAKQLAPVTASGLEEQLIQLESGR